MIATAEMMQGGYWAVLPAAVRRDRRLTQTAKLLYGEITGLTQVDGFCWATDAYFAGVLECSVKTVSRSLGLLKECGYIQVERTSNAQGTERHIYAGLDPAQGGMDKNVHTVEGMDGGMDKNVQTPTNNKNNKNTTGARGKTDEAAQVLEDFAGEDPRLASALRDFREDRRRRGKPMRTALAAKRLTAKLEKLSGGSRSAMIVMLDKAIERGWDSVYALRPDELPETVPRRTEDAPDVEDWTPGVTA